MLRIGVMLVALAVLGLETLLALRAVEVVHLEPWMWIASSAAHQAAPAKASV